MLIKEYRIPMPMAVEEYRIAQLYMIVKKSREETVEAGSGVEIIKNEPYTNGPGGSGQYTLKIFHIERHLPAWFKSIVPANAMIIEEQAWNSYPYTKTRLRCPFVERFTLDIETSYQTDFGSQENIFQLTKEELAARQIEFIDIVQGQPAPENPSEDPTVYRSKKTGRGPLSGDWLEKIKKNPSKENMMCAYKLCRVEFRYWGMQSRCERFIQEMAIRRMILRAHRQAWCWQDEYHDLTLADIRRLEDETQRELNERMARFLNKNPAVVCNPSQLETNDNPRNRSNSKRLSRTEDFHLDDEFFDAQSYLEGLTSARPSCPLIESIDNIPLNETIGSDSYLSTVDDDDRIQGPQINSDEECPTDILLMIFYGGNIFSTEESFSVAKKTDFLSFRSTFDTILQHKYTKLQGRIAIRFVECRSISIETIDLLHRLSPYGALAPSSDVTHSDTLPINALPLFAIANPNYQKTLSDVIGSANEIYQEFLSSNEGKYFNGKVVFIGDANGAILAYDALCSNQILSPSSSPEDDEGLFTRTNSSVTRAKYSRHDSDSSPSLTHSCHDPFYANSSSSIDENLQRKETRVLSFSVNEFFSFGSPLSMIVAYRQIQTNRIIRPSCEQLYNLFHACDPNAARLEPLIHKEFSQIPSCCVPRYLRQTYADDQSTLLIESIHQYATVFANPGTIVTELENVWWGSRRIDYIVYCPPALNNQAAHYLPILFHSSYWESPDVIAFVLKNITRVSISPSENNLEEKLDRRVFTPVRPNERWLHRTTAVKIRNLTPNHRANDTLVVDSAQQIIQSKFFYGPLDVICLANEKIDIYVMRSAPFGEWRLLETVETNSHGRVTYILPEEKKLPIGLHSIKLVVCGDNSSVDLCLTVLPPKSEAVIFSIDGSFSCSFSVSHHNPKVRPGAVDVARYWQELGYIIIYVTSRPDLQQNKVVHWLAEHNFPHGMTMFNNGVSRAPSRLKGDMIRKLVENADLTVVAAYGSVKDVSIYQSINVPAQRIFVIGKYKARFRNRARFIEEGYALHLAELSQPGVVRASKSDSRHLIRRGYFNLPKLVSFNAAQSFPSFAYRHQPESPRAFSIKSKISYAQNSTSESPAHSDYFWEQNSNFHENQNHTFRKNHSRPIDNNSQSYSKIVMSSCLSPTLHRNTGVVNNASLSKPKPTEQI